jgi:ABC-2 type transport system permease protein
MIAVSLAMPLSAAAHVHRGPGRYILLSIIVILVVAGVIVLVQRRRDRRPLGEATAAAREPAASREEETIPVPRSQSTTADPPRQSTVGERKKELPPGHYGIVGLLRSEWTKLRTVRSTMWTLGLTIVIGVVLGGLATGVTRANWATMSPSKQAGYDPIGSSLTGVFFGTFTIGVLGALVMSGEYGTGTIRAVFCAAPRRPWVLAAKALVFAAVALVISEITAFASFFLGQALLTAPAPHATIGSPGALRAVVAGGLYLCVMGLLSLGLAAMIRHTAGAISAFAGVLLLIPVIVQQLPSSLDNDLARYTPLRIGVAQISGTPQPNTFSPWIGLAILVGYAAVFLVSGAVLLVKRDA